MNSWTIRTQFRDPRTSSKRWQNYLQVHLDEESKRILVINMHKGLFHYKRSPFDVESAPAIYQKVMGTMVADILKVAVYLDDITLKE
ncbi:hypothetical protein D918_07381 [Trichuris suis]|nr:hypothetical protein D918_07381 [Trichuris suis]